VNEASQDLVAAARNGDRAALEELLRLHHDRIHALARRITGNDADAADATQEALLAIVRGLPRFDGRSAFSTWAYRVTSNACLDELRRRRRRPLVALVDDRAEPPDPAVPIETMVADRLRLDAALGQLPEDFRVAVVLCDVVGLQYDEIADDLGVPIGTVRSRIHRGRSLLRKALTA
jgi:RNA polymerase sigma-70 factor, ECF subfamily